MTSATQPFGRQRTKPTLPTSLLSILRPRPEGSSTPSGARIRMIRAFLSAVFRMITVSPTLSRSSAVTNCMRTHCSLCAPAGVSQRTCQSPWVDLTGGSPSPGGAIETIALGTSVVGVAGPGGEIDGASVAALVTLVGAGAGAGVAAVGVAAWLKKPVKYITATAMTITARRPATPARIGTRRDRGSSGSSYMLKGIVPT